MIANGRDCGSFPIDRVKPLPSSLASCFCRAIGSNATKSFHLGESGKLKNLAFPVTPDFWMFSYICFFSTYKLNRMFPGVTSYPKDTSFKPELKWSINSFLSSNDLSIKLKLIINGSLCYKVNYFCFPCPVIESFFKRKCPNYEEDKQKEQSG